MNCVSCGSPEVDREGGISTCQKCGKSFVPLHYKLFGYVQRYTGQMPDDLVELFFTHFAEERQVRSDSRAVDASREVTHVHPPKRSTTPFMKSLDGYCTITFANGLLTILHQVGGGAEPGERSFEFDPVHLIREFGPMMLQQGYCTPSGEVSIGVGASPFSTPPSFLEIKIFDQAPICVSESDFGRFLKDLKSIYGNSD